MQIYFKYKSSYFECEKMFQVQKSKNINDFFIDNGTKDKRQGLCKECKKELQGIWNKANPTYYKKYSEINKIHIANKNRKWAKNNPEKNCKKSQKWYANHLEKARALIKKNNIKQYNKNKNIPTYKLNHSMRNQIRKSISGGISKNGRHWEGLVGYTASDLKKHLEKQFTKGMSWDNYGIYGWHIDHKIPISAFNFNEINDIDFKKCWALSNLQPLWADENHKKHNKLTAPFQPSLAIAV